MIALAGLAVLLGFAQYRFVEERFRRNLTGGPRRWWNLLAVTAALLGFTGTLAAAVRPKPDRNMAPIQGLASDCQQAGTQWRELPACQTSSQPTVMLWGDSYAIHLIPGLMSALAGTDGLIQATMYACAPTLGLAQVGGKYSSAWASECVQHNAKVAGQLTRLKSVRFVLIASSYGQVFGNGPYDLSVDGHVTAWQPVASEHLERSVRAVQVAGKTPILIGTTPIAPFDVGACNARFISGRPIFGSPHCEVWRQDVEAKVGATNRENRRGW